MKASKDVVMVLLGGFTKGAKVGKVFFVKAHEFANGEHFMTQFHVMDLSPMLLSHSLAVYVPVDLIEGAVWPIVP